MKQLTSNMLNQTNKKTVEQISFYSSCLAHSPILCLLHKINSLHSFNSQNISEWSIVWISLLRCCNANCQFPLIKVIWLNNWFTYYILFSPPYPQKEVGWIKVLLKRDHLKKRKYFHDHLNFVSV